MTKRWKLKLNSSNILLVLITLILVKAEWVKGENENCQGDNNFEEGISYNDEDGQTHIYIGNDEIAEYFFHSSINDNSFILDEINKCLDSFQLITCVKMLLLSKINDVVNLMTDTNAIQKEVSLLNGLFVFKIKNETKRSATEENEYLNLDEEISDKVKRIFWKRSLLVNLFPKIKIEIQPALEKNSGGLICFNYKVHKELELKVRDKNDKTEGRKKKGGGMSMTLLVPQLIMLGLMPLTLASLKAMVMNAVMINMMALNGAIFMTIRNLVFGPRQGDNVKYVNYGYSKDRQTQSSKPVLIIHSPAAFVKQPPVHKKRVNGHSSTHHFPQNYFSENRYSNDFYSYLNHHQNVEIIEDYVEKIEDNITKQDENQQGKRRQATEESDNSGNFSGFYKKNAIEQAKRIQNGNKNINHLSPFYQKNYKPQVRVHEKIQKQSSYNHSSPTQSPEKFISNSVYSSENEKRTPHLAFNKFRKGSRSEFKQNPQFHAVVQQNQNLNLIKQNKY